MKKINKILIGTHNLGKFREISYLLSKKIEKISPVSLKIKSPKETGKTYEENSKLKASYFAKKSGLISISDDSGLSIACLKGKPGIHSARFAKTCGGFKKAMQKIINLVNNKKNTKAFFACSLTVYYSKKKIITVIGKINGNISSKILGKNGFGYDSIFIPQNYKKTFGQMKKKEKIKIDHRSVAFKKLKSKIKI